MLLLAVILGNILNLILMSYNGFSLPLTFQVH